MTPQEILELSEPVEQVYTDVVAQLIENICRHLGEGKDLSTQEWELKKLSELNALTNESIKIIQQASGKSKKEIEHAISTALGIGAADTDALLAGVALTGVVAEVSSIEHSEALIGLLKSLVDQAEDRANLVNTVMLQSTRQRYIWAINNTVDTERKLIEKLFSANNLSDLDKQLAKVQEALNKAVSAVEVGSEARVQALSRTVKQLADEGITGFVDAGGHHWSPEAYMNMDIRTTVHNAYIQAQRERSAEYGIHTFQITSHAGARPRCAPFQGWICSWEDGGYTVLDGYGSSHEVHNIYDTSYGEPAGIFGKLCAEIKPREHYCLVV